MPSAKFLGARERKRDTQNGETEAEREGWKVQAWEETRYFFVAPVNHSYFFFLASSSLRGLEGSEDEVLF
jgi:hypothetical protein